MTGGATPLHMCGMSRRGQQATALLIRLGGALEAEDTCGGYTPLGRMASNNLAAGAEALLQAGADPGHANHAGDTPLATAEQSGAHEAAAVIRKYAVQRRRDPNLEY